MNFVIDAGNTLIKTAIYNGNKLVRTASSAVWTTTFIRGLLDGHPAIRSFLICSTRQVPSWLPDELTNRQIPWMDVRYDMPLPIRIGYKTPETLGNDRIAAAAGAAALLPGRNVLAIDAGTALTIDLVTADGLFLGGNISPGMKMRFTALHQNTYRLPEISQQEEIPVIGQSTTEAILAGVVNGIAYEIDNSINSLKNKYNDLAVIMTGGDARYLSRLLKNTIFVEENLVLSGLNAILRNFSEKAF
jgi:type III pantothenate kinase